MGYFFLRYALAPIAMIGWIFYQIIFKEKKWKEVRKDAFVIFVFILFWLAIFYWLLS